MLNNIFFSFRPVLCDNGGLWKHSDVRESS